MAYCRCGDDSDIYLIGSVGGHHLMFAHKTGREDEVIANPADTLKRLRVLRKEGLKVPFRAIRRLLREINS